MNKQQDIYNEISNKYDKRRKIYLYTLIALLVALALIFAYYSGKSSGKTDVYKEQLKQDIKQLEEEKTIDAVNTSNESKILVKKADNIIKPIPRNPPKIKDTTTEAKYQYLKNLRK